MIYRCIRRGFVAQLQSVPYIQYSSSGTVPRQEKLSIAKAYPAESGGSNPCSVRSAGEKVLSPNTFTSAYESDVEVCRGLDPLLYVCNTRRHAEKEEAEYCQLEARQGEQGFSYDPWIPGLESRGEKERRVNK
jgi:hypothetical protein